MAETESMYMFSFLLAPRFASMRARAKLTVWRVLRFVVPADVLDNIPLTINADMLTIVRAMARPNSGLEVRDRLWLKITIPNAFIGT